MACASCGGGRQLTPNKQQSPPIYVQSPNRIVVNPNAKAGGNKIAMTPNGGTKRTQV